VGVDHDVCIQTHVLPRSTSELLVKRVLLQDRVQLGGVQLKRLGNERLEGRDSLIHAALVQSEIRRDGPWITSLTARP